MKLYLLAALGFLLLNSCNNVAKNKGNKTSDPSAQIQPEAQRFFPVTVYLKGQLFDYRRDGIIPLKYTTIKGHTDSAWIKMEDVDNAIKEFMEPEIDSTNLITLFTEKKFLDQTLNAYTFTYEPTGQLPDSMKLNHWDVYIDPETNKVKRIYIVKTSPGKTLQLTWLSNKWCKINTILTKPDGTSELEKEEKLVWAFDNQ
jgi:hypothetical protein